VQCQCAVGACALHVAVYKKHEACIKEVERNLSCLGVYPQYIRIAVSDEQDTSEELSNLFNSRYESELDIVYHGFSVHL